MEALGDGKAEKQIVQRVIDLDFRYVSYVLLTQQSEEAFLSSSHVPIKKTSFFIGT